MKPGRVIGGDEHEARTLAQQIVIDARTEAARLLDDARAEATLRIARADAEAQRLRDDAQVLANRLVEDARDRERLGPAPTGTVDEVVGLVMRATVPGVALGELVRIDRRSRIAGGGDPDGSAGGAGPGPRGIDRRNGEPLTAEVVGFRGEQAVLLPLGDVAGVAPACAVRPTGAPLSIRCGEQLLGRVLDGIGAPLDDGPPLTGEVWPVDRAAPAALARPPITLPLATGVRVIDTMLTLGRGQRVGLFAAAGVGKSTLLGQIARGSTADVIVLCLVGERGRELAELLGDELASARARTVVVCATSDAPALVRLRAVHVATAIAEWFRDRRGASVLLLCDSLTRVARAQREVGLSA
ncbi:MAG: hypothetical protein ABIY55_11490, partial [Kofleriaceae bacterium]